MLWGQQDNQQMDSMFKESDSSRLIFSHFYCTFQIENGKKYLWRDFLNTLWWSFAFDK